VTELCQWDPANNRPAQGVPDRKSPTGYKPETYTGCPNPATIVAGSRCSNTWHLCESCTVIHGLRGSRRGR
jgi:hypothetical protein